MNARDYKWALILRLVVAVAVYSVPAISQTAQGFSYYFPGVTPDIDFVIGNTNDQTVPVTVAFYRTAGDVSSTSFLLEPGKQSRLNSKSAAVTDFSGGVVIASALALTVSASLFTGDTPFDFILPSDASTSLIVPFAPLDSAAVDVNIFNPGTDQAEVKVIPVKTDGTEQGVTTASVGPKQSTVVHLSTTAGVSHIFLRTSGFFRGDRPIAANAYIRNYSPSTSGAVQRTDFAVVGGIPMGGALAKTSLPFFMHGEDYFSMVEVVNLAETKQNITVTAHHPDGSLIAGTKNPAVLDGVPAFGSTRQSFADLFGLSVTQLTEGYITVEGEQLVEAAVGIGNISKPSLAVFTSDNRDLGNFAYQIRRTGREFFTILSFWNRSDRDANVAMSFLDDDGRTISTIGLVAPRGQQLIADLAKLFPEVQGNGVIVTRSDVALVAAGIDGRSDNSALAARRPLFAATSFVAPPLDHFLAVGTVFDQTEGVAGVAISLSGPVASTTLTDADGVFVFRDIPPGTYTLTPIPIGYTVTPLQRTFTITNDNSRNNDFAVGLIPPQLDTVTPEGAVVHSDTTTITLQGKGFISGNVAVFDVTELPTTFVSDTTLTAVIDKSLLTVSGDIPIVVRNRGPSGVFVDSAPLSFTVGDPPAILTSVTGQPSPLMAGSVTSPFTITIRGAGFTPATQVRANRKSRQTSYRSQTEVQAIILPDDVSQPGFVPITVVNPGAVPSAPFQLPVLYPTPRITAISPSTLTAQVSLNAQGIRLTVNGAGFVQDPNDASVTSVVLIDGGQVQTELISSTQLIASVPASLISTGGIKQIAVVNPQPALGPSDNAPLLVVNPPPVLTSVNAGPVSYDPAQTATVWLSVPLSGANFSSQSEAWVSLPCDTLGFRKARTTTRTSSEQIVAEIPIRCPGSYGLQVQTPQPGGGTSNTLNLNVASSSSQPAQALSNAVTFAANPLPVVLSAAAAAPATNGQNLQTVSVTVIGANFVSNSEVWVSVPCDSVGFRQVQVTSRVGSEQLTATIPLQCAGTYLLQVRTPEPGGGTSNTVSLNLVVTSAVAQLFNRRLSLEPTKSRLL